MSRPIGIPGDLVVGDVIQIQAGVLPKLWHKDFHKIQLLHDLGITGKGVKIAINDTGFRSHPYLPEPIAKRDFTGSRSGTDAVSNHSVHCAGTALGRRDSNGVSLGIAPDAELIIAKVLGDSGSGSTTGINKGRVWAAEQGADIISESLGDGGGPDIPEDIRSFDTAYKAGASICVAALGNAGFRGVGRPGSYRQTCGVAALNESGKRADFSSVGDPADLAFGGQNIISCNNNGGLISMSGTSMATPGVAGVLALVMQYMQMVGIPRPMGWQEWREFWSQPQFVKDVGAPGRDKEYGFGIPQVSSIVDWMLNPSGA